jgi:hypothetical protein
MITMIIEHMAAVYLFLPLIPSLIHTQTRVQPKNHPETKEPDNQVVMHASITFSAVHWCLRLTFLAEINPPLSLIKSVLWVWQNPEHSVEIWDECLMAVWGQCIGFLIALVYIVHYLPLRKSVILSSDNG